MRVKTLIPLFVLVLLVSLSALPVSCCQLGGDSSGGADMISMMKKMPAVADSGLFLFMDFSAVRADDDLRDFYEDRSLQSLGENLTERTGLDWEGIEQLGGSGSVSLYEGDFDLDDARGWLESNDYDEKDYMGVEVWEEVDSDGRSVALMSGLIIAGEIGDDVKDCIDVIEGGEDSLYDDRDIKDVADRLPSGFFATVDLDSGITYWRSDDYEGIEVRGSSGAKHDSDSIQLTVIIKFEDEDTAEHTLDNIREDIQNDFDELKNINVTRDGQFVKATFERDIEDM